MLFRKGGGQSGEWWTSAQLFFFFFASSSAEATRSNCSVPSAMSTRDGSPDEPTTVASAPLTSGAPDCERQFLVTITRAPARSSSVAGASTSARRRASPVE